MEPSFPWERAFDGLPGAVATGGLGQSPTIHHFSLPSEENNT